MVDDFSPLYFKSCGGDPIEAKGKIFVPEPIFVYPSIDTCEIISTSASYTTLDPTVEYGPTLTPFAIFADLEIIAVG